MISHVVSPTVRPGLTRSLTVSELTGERAFLELKDEWNKLVEEDVRATVFQTWEMQYHIWRCFADRISPVIVSVRDETGRLAALAPLGASRPRVGGLPIRVLGFAAPRYADYAGFVVRPDRSEEALAALADWFRRAHERWDVIRLGPLREDGWLLGDSQRFIHLLGDEVRAERVDTALSLRVGNRMPEQARPRSLDKEVRRLFRRTDGRFQEVPAGAALNHALKDLFGFHQDRMHSHNERGVFGDQGVQVEFSELVRALHAKGLARMHRVETGGATIAVTCTFEFRGTVSFYQSAFDPAFRRLGPGKILRALRIEEALRDGAEECDFLRGDEPYKQLHATDRRPLHAIELRTGSWRRLPYHGWKRLRARLSESPWARALYLRLRPRKSRPEILTA